MVVKNIVAIALLFVSATQANITFEDTFADNNSEVTYVTHKEGEEWSKGIENTLTEDANGQVNKGMDKVMEQATNFNLRLQEKIFDMQSLGTDVKKKLGLSTIIYYNQPGTTTEQAAATTTARISAIRDTFASRVMVASAEPVSRCKVEAFGIQAFC